MTASRAGSRSSRRVSPGQARAHQAADRRPPAGRGASPERAAARLRLLAARPGQGPDSRFTNAGVMPPYLEGRHQRSTINATHDRASRSPFRHGSRRNWAVREMSAAIEYEHLSTDIHPIDMVETLGEEAGWEFDRIGEDQIAMAV